MWQRNIVGIEGIDKQVTPNKNLERVSQERGAKEGCSKLKKQQMQRPRGDRKQIVPSWNQKFLQEGARGEVGKKQTQGYNKPHLCFILKATGNHRGI